MKLTLDMLKEKRACEPGIELYKQHGCPDTVDTTVALCMQEGEYEYANWLLCNVAFDTRQRRLYVINAAELALPIFEAAYPDDTRPRDAIVAAKKYAEGEITIEQLHDAAHATRAIAYALADAVYACAAANVAYAAYAACAVDTAHHAAAVYVVDAAYYAADAIGWGKIIDFGLTLIKG